MTNLYRPYIATSPRCVALSRQPERSGDLNVTRLDALHAGFGHLLPGCGERAIEVDRARGVLDHVGRETQLAGIDGAPKNAEVGVEPGQENCVDATCLQIGAKAGRGLAVGLLERR